MPNIMSAKKGELPGDVTQDFRRILNFSDETPIPAGVAAAYHVFRKAKDVCSAGGVTTSELILLAMLAGYPKEKERE